MFENISESWQVVWLTLGVMTFIAIMMGAGVLLSIAAQRMKLEAQAKREGCCPLCGARPSTDGTESHITV